MHCVPPASRVQQAVDTDVLGVARSMPAEFGTVQPSHTVPNRLATRLPPPTSNEVASTSGCEDAMEKDSTFDEKVPSSTAPEVAQSLFQEPVAEEYLGWRAGHSEEDQARPKTSRGLQPASPSPGMIESVVCVRNCKTFHAIDPALIVTVYIYKVVII